MKKTVFGTMPDGTAVHLYTLESKRASCDILTYGGVLRALHVPGRDGKTVDVALGFDTLEDYLSPANNKFLGALVGRYANRIGGAGFELNGVHYGLSANDGANHLHGGPGGFFSRVWTAESAGDGFLTLTLESPDGDEGYPGRLSVRVTYRLEDLRLTVEYEAVSDRDTLCNLTNHAYFNLSGHDSGPVTDETIQILGDAYTPTDPSSIPTGCIAPVEGTPMDLREPVAIGVHVDDGFDQLVYAGGYDQNWVLNGESGVLRPAARAYSPRTGISMEVLTTLPGLQFYSGNSLDGCPRGKDGAPYAKRWGFCLETQFFPDSPHHPNFPSAVLRKGQSFHHVTAFCFGTR